MRTMKPNTIRSIRRLANLVVVMGLMLVFSRSAFAQEAEAVASPVDTVWVLVCAALVFFMQAGFGMLEAGFVRTKNVVTIMAENFMDTSMSAIGFFTIGFGLMFASGNSFFGTDWFFLRGLPDVFPGLTIPGMAFFFFQFAFCAAAATIASGLMAERTRFSSHLVLAFFTALFIFPVYGHWVWGGGWLAQLGYLDFAGSSVVHMTGALVGLAGVLVMGKRKDKVFGKPIQGHSIALATLGTFILWLGWFGFNPGSALAADPNAISLIMVTTNFAACAGAFVAIVLSRYASGGSSHVWDVGMALNGALGGLVAITANAAWVTPIASIIIGGIAGVVVFYGVALLEKLKIDDAVGALPVHGFAGIFGLLATGIWAVDGVGLLSGGGFRQLGIQAVGIVANIAWVLPVSLLMMYAIHKTIGLRVSPEVEDLGIDMAHHGIGAYPEFIPDNGSNFRPAPTIAPSPYPAGTD